MADDTPVWFFDPTAHLDWTWDWSTWLQDGETIVSETVTAPPGFALDMIGRNTEATAVTAWVTIGDPAVATPAALIVCNIVTSGAREDARRVRLLLKDR